MSLQMNVYFQISLDFQAPYERKYCDTQKVLSNFFDDELILRGRLSLIYVLQIFCSLARSTYNFAVGMWPLLV